MSWRYGESTVAHLLPIGVAKRAAEGDAVRAGDVIASGTVYGTPVRLAGARRLGLAAHDLSRVMRVAPGAEVERGAILARTGRRFARAVTAPFAGRLAHIRADGDIELAPIVDRWLVRAVIDGTVTRASDLEITVAGDAWCLQGVAAYGPDAIGELAMVADGPTDEVVPSRIDVTQRDRILVGGGRSGPEAIARAHACGVAAVVAGAVPAAGLRAIFGDEVSAHGLALREDAPTVLCLAGFGTSALPESLYSPLRVFAGSRAAIHTASARLFVFATSDSVAVSAMPPSLALSADWGAVRALDGRVTIEPDMRFASEVQASGVATESGPVPATNVLPVGAER